VGGLRKLKPKKRGGKKRKLGKEGHAVLLQPPKPGEEKAKRRTRLLYLFISETKLWIQTKKVQKKEKSWRIIGQFLLQFSKENFINRGTRNAKKNRNQVPDPSKGPVCWEKKPIHAVLWFPSKTGCSHPGPAETSAIAWNVGNGRAAVPI